jgi:preprotein translocase subunit SecG
MPKVKAIRVASGAGLYNDSFLEAGKSMLYYFAVVVYVLVCLVLMLVILLQQGKGGDIASAFGGGGGSQTAFGARSGATVLSRATTVGAVLFILGALVLGILGQRGPNTSVVGGRAPQLPPATQLPAPAGTVPPPVPITATPKAPAAPAQTPAPAAPAQAPAPKPAQ